MRKEELMGSYDAIFSLGDLCLTSMQLKRHGLRSYSGVFDWAATPSLSKVNLMLKNRFADFMKVEHLRAIGPATDTMLCVADEHYGFVSNHDFELSKNTMTYLGSYYEVMDKYTRRINRFLHTLNTARRILFVRTEGDFAEVMELQAVLRGMVRNDFSILVINHEPVSGIVEENWPLPNVYAVAFPDSVDKWTGNDALWTEVLQGISLGY